VSAPTLLMDGILLGECPRWHDGKLWVADWVGQKLLTLDGAGQQTVEAKIASLPFSFDWLPDGRMLVNSMHERVVLVWDGHSLELYADLRELAISSINDMVVDADGRAYVTQLGFDLFAGEEARDSALLVVEPDASVHEAAGIGEFSCANGIAVTADGSRVLTAEVSANRITVMDRAGDGTLSNRRVFSETPWLPDGLCLDDQGGAWAGMPGCGYVARFVEGGAMTDAIAIPMDQGMGVACVLGGSDRSTLYICAGLEVFDWAKSREGGLGTIWTAPTQNTAGASRP